MRTLLKLATGVLVAAGVLVVGWAIAMFSIAILIALWSN